MRQQINWRRTEKGTWQRPKQSKKKAVEDIIVQFRFMFRMRNVRDERVPTAGDSRQCERKKREGRNHIPEHCNGSGVRNVLWFQFEWVRISTGIFRRLRSRRTREAMICRDGVSARSPSEKCWVEGCQVIVRLVLCRERQKHVKKTEKLEEGHRSHSSFSFHLNTQVWMFFQWFRCVLVAGVALSPTKDGLQQR